jgi:hypothetical protein
MKTLTVTDGLSFPFKLSPLNPMRRITLKRIAVAAAIISLVLIQAYLETSLNFTPNH